MSKIIKNGKIKFYIDGGENNVINYPGEMTLDEILKIFNIEINEYLNQGIHGTAYIIETKSEGDRTIIVPVKAERSISHDIWIYNDEELATEEYKEFEGMSGKILLRHMDIRTTNVLHERKF